MEGRLLAGRYRIDALVGTGGMAVVYRALDTLTGRTVAIKLLRPEYESDVDFVRRFSHEAEAAAKMSHENIVNLLDVGIDGEQRFIVMEYVDGRTLKDMIREEGRIHPDVALRMTIRILAAVDHAHRNGIVHRDIKPQNILVDRDGRVKVADFGIARLKTAQDVGGEGEDSALGSVHYLSPEQARGEVADEQSDLYSVGIVLYEMLVGHVPFEGESSVSVALKHVREAPRSLRSENSHISPALDEVVMRALSKDKKLRYRSAAEMAADLRETIAHPEGGFVHYPGEESDASGEGRKAQHPRRPGRQPRQPKTRHSRLKRTLAIALVVVLIASAAMVGFYLYLLQHSVRMPNLLGLPRAEALSAMESLGIGTELTGAYSEDYADGRIMAQSQEPGERLRKDAQVTLTVSMGSQWYLLEDMKGWDEDTARAALEAENVTDYSLEYAQSEAPVGTVISMSREPGWVSRDTPLVLLVSGRSVTVPNFSGMTLDGARAVIGAEGLALGEVVEEDSPDARSGTVIAQSVVPYTRVLVGSTVDLTVCRQQQLSYAPGTPLMISVPLDMLEVHIELILPSGGSVEAFRETLSLGTHQVNLRSSERGVHTVNIYMDSVLLESLRLDFE